MLCNNSISIGSPALFMCVFLFYLKTRVLIVNIPITEQDSYVSAWVCHCQADGCNSAGENTDNSLLVFMSMLALMSSSTF